MQPFVTQGAQCAHTCPQKKSCSMMKLDSSNFRKLAAFSSERILQAELSSSSSFSLNSNALQSLSTNRLLVIVISERHCQKNARKPTDVHLLFVKGHRQEEWK